MTESDRRAFLSTSASLTVGAALAGLTPAATFAQGTPPAAAKLRPYAIKPMPFDPQKIHGLSERILISHYENNYAGAVKRLNSIADQLATLDYEKAPVFTVNGLKREELIATNSMILHEAFFAGLGDESSPGAPLAEAIARDFGSMERWRSQFTAMGRAEGGGSGWVILTYSPRDKRLVNAWAADHTTTLAGGTPILVLDMYEHAYHMDFGAKAAGYVDTFMKVVRWQNADQLYEQASRA
jgi:Fe-Mn family superoxide dismutase